MRVRESLEELVQKAAGGSREALDAVVRAVQDDVYALALRMLWHPADAADATQEILIKIVTHLGSFRGESAFRTWCFRIASNHLLTAQKSRGEQRARSFEEVAEVLGDLSPAPAAASDPEARLLEEEVKLSCTLGILLCLDREHRLAYILGAVLALPGDEGATICEVPAATYRKRLSRARERMREFFGERCGLVQPDAACRCARRVGPVVSAGLISPDRLLFARHALRGPDAGSLLEKTRELEELSSEVALYRSHPDYQAPDSALRSIRELLRTRGPSVLSD
jgi:RNA polymerase sigma factor (sigma-70 family)